MVQLEPPVGVTSLHKIRASARTDKYHQMLGSDGSVLKASQAELLYHSISILNYHKFTAEVYGLGQPTLILKTLERGGVVATYQLFIGLMMFTISVMNAEHSEEYFREKCSFEGEPEEVEVMRKG